MKTAHTVMVMFCESCDAVHLVLYDEEDRPFAQAVIDDDIMASMQNALLRAVLRHPTDKVQ